MDNLYKHSPRYIGIRKQFEKLDPYKVLDEFDAPHSEENKDRALRQLLKNHYYDAGYTLD